LSLVRRSCPRGRSIDFMSMTGFLFLVLLGCVRCLWQEE
jgi:hypothetical protein